MTKRQMIEQATAILATEWAHAAARVCADVADDIEDDKAELTVEAIVALARPKVAARREYMTQQADKGRKWTTRAQKRSLDAIKTAASRI